MQPRTNAQPCSRCPEEAIVGLETEWLCSECFNAALEVKREEIEAIILAFEEEFGVNFRPDYEPPTFTLRLPPRLGARFGTMQIFPAVDEIESPLLCGSDDEPAA